MKRPLLTRGIERGIKKVLGIKWYWGICPFVQIPQYLFNTQYPFLIPFFLNIKPEVHHVPVAHHIFLAFHAHFPGLFHGGF